MYKRKEVIDSAPMYISSNDQGGRLIIVPMLMCDFDSKIYAHSYAPDQISNLRYDFGKIIDDMHGYVNRDQIDYEDLGKVHDIAQEYAETDEDDIDTREDLYDQFCEAFNQRFNYYISTIDYNGANYFQLYRNNNVDDECGFAIEYLVIEFKGSKTNKFYNQLFMENILDYIIPNCYLPVIQAIKIHDDQFTNSDSISKDIFSIDRIKNAIDLYLDFYNCDKYSSENIQSFDISDIIDEYEQKYSLDNLMKEFFTIKMLNYYSGNKLYNASLFETIESKLIDSGYKVNSKNLLEASKGIDFTVTENTHKDLEPYKSLDYKNYNICKFVDDIIEAEEWER